MIRKKFRASYFPMIRLENGYRFSHAMQLDSVDGPWSKFTVAT